MIGYFTGPKDATYVPAPAPEPAAMAQWRRHVKNGTVPPANKIPYTRTGVEKYRHSSVQDEFKPGQQPIFPAWTRTAHALQVEILRAKRNCPSFHGFNWDGGEVFPHMGANMSTAFYIGNWEQTRHYKK